MSENEISPPPVQDPTRVHSRQSGSPVPENDICPLVQDLLPLYDAGEVNETCREMVAAHLAACQSCRAALDMYRQPLFDTETKEAIRTGEPAPRFLQRLQRLGLIAAVLILLAGSGLAWASYRAGQAITLRDPDFRRAIQEKLFTPVHQTGKVGAYTITVERLLLDSTRTVVFYHVEPALDERPLDLKMADDKGNNYEQRSSRGYQGRDFVAELAAVDPAAERLQLAFTTPDEPAAAQFDIAVNPAAVQVTTRELWPELQLNPGELRLDVEHILLGVSRSQVDIRAFWPLEQGIRGLGLGKVFLPGPVMEAGKARSAAAGFINTGRGEALPGEQAGLLDVTNRRQLAPEGLEWRTDSTSGGLQVKLSFAPVAGASRELSLQLPPLYLYRPPASPAAAPLDLTAAGSSSLNLNLAAGAVNLQLTGISRNGNELRLDYRLPAADEGRWPLYLPELVLATPAGREVGGQLEDVNADGGRVVFYLPSRMETEGSQAAAADPTGQGLSIKLKSLGRKLVGEQELAIPVPALE